MAPTPVEAEDATRERDVTDAQPSAAPAIEIATEHRVATPRPNEVVAIAPEAALVAASTPVSTPIGSGDLALGPIALPALALATTAAATGKSTKVNTAPAASTEPVASARVVPSPELFLASVAVKDGAAQADPLAALRTSAARSEQPATPQPDTVALPPATREILQRAVEPAPEMPRAPASDTAADILRQIRLQLSPELRQATLSLAPPELGRISIRLTLEDHRLTAWVRGEKPETIELLGKHLPELRATLAARGIEAEHFELALGFQDRERSHGGDSRPSHSSARRAEAPSETVELAPLARALASANGVDTFA